MNIWYMHVAPKGWHERNLYLCQEVAKSWRSEGHRVAILNLNSGGHLQSIERKNVKADVAYITNFHSTKAMENADFDIVKRARFRVYITGGGWRRPDWVRRSLNGIKSCKPHIVCLTHLPHRAKFEAAHKKVFHVGLGFDPAVFRPDVESRERREWWIAFCGNPGMGRERRLELLRSEFPGKVHWTRELSHAQMSKYLHSAKIGWNQMGRGPSDGVSCNLRVWELAGSGVFQLCSRSKHMPLRDGIHYVAWDSDRDMLDKALYYATLDDERELIARQGYEEAIKRHTWAHRAQEYKTLIEKYL